MQTAFFRVTSPEKQPAIRYKYYELDSTEEIQQLPDFGIMKSLREGKVREFRLTDVPNRGKQFAVEFTAKIVVPQKGKYRFFTLSDDGSKLYINNKQEVDNDGNHGSRGRSGSADLDAGEHDIKVTYYNGGNGKWLDVYWSGPNMPKQIIAPDYLK